MKVLLSWLREFAPVEGDPAELAGHLSDLGLAVESTTVLPALDGVVVGRVAGLRPHPRADRIQLVDVDVGAGAPGEPAGAAPSLLQVCCGAFNMSVGDLVPLAGVGTVMPDGMEIGERRMRGELSRGMCCSPAELGLGADHDGIMILPPDLAVGEPVMSQLGLAGDVLFDLEVNPNRPDALSVAGVARDLAARLGVPFAVPTPQVAETDEDVAAAASVRIVDADLCGRFVVRVVGGVAVGPSPTWLQLRLALCGMRPVNSVVDVSNFVMLELGTPSHAYDLDKVPAGAIGTRRSPGGESVETLDGQTRTLAAGDGVIVDGADEVIGIAGVMGGAATEIGDGTTAVLLEMAWWDGTSIAATSQRLGLRSEASIRFERGTDWALNALAADRFCELLAEITPGGVQVCRGALDERGTLPEPPQVRVRPARMGRLLGRDFDAAELTGLLEPLGFDVAPADDGTLAVTVPTFRPDTATETDVAEEVARHHGYGRLGRTTPRSPTAGRLTSAQLLRRHLRQVLLGEGVSEAMPNPFLAPDALARAGLEAADPVRLLNPLAVEESVLRPSLLPGLLTAVGYNESHRNEDVSLFELGVVFAAPAGDGPDGGPDLAAALDPNVVSLPRETERLAVVLAGRDAHAATRLLRVVADALGVEVALANTADVGHMHPTRAA
ncbi:MAG TPA: phenylalanine--tRNA ligase subunit beta, partial [Acidimicrobiaceae bacterium]|nr:phenylalanine--tRNA ligase subunit beta [Acidimicrobiaceae bacterium]